MSAEYLTANSVMVGRMTIGSSFCAVALYLPGMPLRCSRLTIKPSVRAADSRRHAADLSSLSAAAMSWALAPSVSSKSAVATFTASIVSIIAFLTATPEPSARMAFINSRTTS